MTDVPHTSLNCPHFKSCSGCVLSKDLHLPAIAIEAKNFFESQNRGKFPIIFDRAGQWRYRAKLAVRGAVENPMIGLFAENSHDVVPISDCVVHHPLINAALQKVRDKLKTHRLKPYDEIRQQGLIRYLQFMVCQADNTLQLTIVVHLASQQEAQFASLQSFLKELWEEEKSIWHSLWVNFNAQKTNTIFGSDWIKVEGQPFLIEYLCGQPFCFQPMVFSQANLPLFEKILKEIIDKVPAGQNIIELYAGIGVIGLLLAQKSRSVICCESHPAAEALFHQTCSLWQHNSLDHVDFYTSPVAAQLQLLQQGNVVIVDPPRKGLDPLLLKALQSQEHTVDQIVYLSCGFASLQRDTLQLLQAGWQIKSSTGYILFPGTNHIETLVVFNRP